MTEPVPTSDPSGQPLEVTPTVVTAIVDHIGNDLVTVEQVNLVLSAWNDVQQGDPVGTIMRDPDTGTIAHRVCQDGRNLWKVTAANGDAWGDLSPTMPSAWEKIA